MQEPLSWGCVVFLGESLAGHHRPIYRYTYLQMSMVVVRRFETQVLTVCLQTKKVSFETFSGQPWREMVGGLAETNKLIEKRFVSEEENKRFRRVVKL